MKKKLFIINELKLTNPPYKKLYAKVISTSVFIDDIQSVKLKLQDCKKVTFTFYSEAIYSEINDFVDGAIYYNEYDDMYYVLNIFFVDV